MYFLAVNFHYIFDEGSFPFPGIYPTPVSRLKNQLTELGRHFEFISGPDLLGAVEDGRSLPEKSCLITFDDGLRSQFENGLPLLDEMGIPAMFFVNGLPYATGEGCLVHKIHYCFANLEHDTFLSLADRFHQRHTGRPLDMEVATESRVSAQYRYDSGERAKLKFVVNHMLDGATREAIVGDIFSQTVEDEVRWCDEWYLTKDQLRELSARNWLGLHGYAHLPLTHDGLCAAADVAHTSETLKNIVGPAAHIYSVSYPYGGPEAVSERVAEVCAQSGMKFGLTMERAFNRSIQSPLLFARVDTNDAPGGKGPAFSFTPEGELAIYGDVTPSRRRYLNEESAIQTARKKDRDQG